MAQTPPHLAPVPAHAVFLTGSLRAGAPPARLLELLSAVEVGEECLIGVGAPAQEALGRGVKGLHPFVSVAGPVARAPSTQGALWMFVRGDDRSRVFDVAFETERAFSPVLDWEERIEAFRYREGRDLSGYEDGTENPVEDAAVEAAIVAGAGPGLDGGTFVSVQRWIHDLVGFAARPQVERDHVVGRALVTNEELADAPSSAHVKRAAQESFEPPAFMVRRSMPYTRGAEKGLYFVAFGESLDRFERVLHRMVGLDDGVTDGLFSFTKPVTGGHYFCPPIREGRLDLRAFSG